MGNRRVFGMVLLLAAAALAAGPSVRLLAASPCAAGAPMACCGGAETGRGEAAPPCGCTLRPVWPVTAVVEQAAPPVVLAEAPAGEAPAPDATSVPAAPRIAPRARAGPLFLLHASLLN